MKGEWCYFKGYFSPEWCDYVLEHGLNLPTQEGSVGIKGNTALGVEPEIRRSTVRFIKEEHTDFKFLFDELWKLAIWANKDWFNFHITNLPHVQLAEYDVSYKGEYKIHQDVFWVNDTEYHRKLSCIIQLTDPNSYDDCDLQFYKVNSFPIPQEMRERGTVIFFPSFVEHAATQITRGTRHSLAAWFEGPKWR